MIPNKWMLWLPGGCRLPISIWNFSRRQPAQPVQASVSGACSTSKMLEQGTWTLWVLAVDKAIGCDYCATGSTSADRLGEALGVRAERPIAFSDTSSGGFKPSFRFHVSFIVTSQSDFRSDIGYLAIIRLMALKF